MALVSESGYIPVLAELAAGPKRARQQTETSPSRAPAASSATVDASLVDSVEPISDEELLAALLDTFQAHDLQETVSTLTREFARFDVVVTSSLEAQQPRIPPGMSREVL
jgi:hypothetical protein